MVNTEMTTKINKVTAKNNEWKLRGEKARYLIELLMAELLFGSPLLL
jgi:hypothetical protein